MANRLMNRMLGLAVGVSIAFSVPLVAATFNLFQPTAGILVGDPSTYITTAAGSDDVSALWSGTCDDTTFLRGDGSCEEAGNSEPEELFYEGEVKVRSYEIGVDVLGSLNNDPTAGGVQDAEVAFFTQDGIGLAGSLGWRGGTTEMAVTNAVADGEIFLIGSTGPGVFVDMARADPNGPVELFYADDETFRTLAAGSGGAEVNNTATGAGFERVLTTSDLGGATPGGANTQVQYNDSGSLGGDSGLTYVDGTGTLTATNYAGGGMSLTGNVDVGGTLDVAGAFETTTNITVTGTGGALYLENSGAPSDEKRWLLQAQDNGIFRFSSRTDANGAGAEALRVLRTGTVIDEVELNATSVDINGAVDVSGTLTAANYAGGGMSLTGNTNFAGGLFVIQNASPQIRMVDTDAAANTGAAMWLNPGTGLQLRFYDDAFSGFSTPVSIQRTGTVTNEVELNATAIDVNGTMDVSGIASFAANHVLESTAPLLRFYETDAGADEKGWRLYAQSDGFRLHTETDAGAAVQTPILVDRTGTNVDSIGLSADSITANGDEVATVESGSFTATLTGMTSATTGTINWYRSGHHITLVAPSIITGTSNSTSMLIQGIPAAIRPTVSHEFQFGFTIDDGTTIGATYSIPDINNDRVDAFPLSSGTSRLIASSYTASGTKGIPEGWSFSYTIE